MYVYVLELENQNYYVGIAEDIGLRLWTHFKMGSKVGSAWTKKYKPIKVVHCSEIFPKTKWKSELVETQCTLRIAKLKGFSKVRGAGFSISNEDYPKSWDEKLAGVPPADFDKMKPLSNQELKVLFKGKYELWLEQRKKRRKPKYS
ncbi:GIY-YIG nuclease family protein [Vibrio parahaemolyticus]|uniref:GIY-YIG nuclease family protein n=1 Tax=Vibrio parahaemolyticus TaxID=670 RepID=UPI0004A4199C|nr:GIY-YIG nuclease family protein [Vibrio parahaemolyticus]EGR0439659.1 GIY-YIG nuclease family protein [Vibrio parahaemolyticus]EGR0766610.1 GIY-YIG nuclease family protein [Vibrio parahaemolyticus]EGR2568538.1 GIY-YIG nuclease family protein [Vibrio parahaemolyticus]EGR3330601.1 GIY-YIG nuclease family protein [Vibrio parahaemolyticus]EHK9610545.1 GIY-YIG nuclease family protein [Vibrio parahaemolyticus]